MRSELPPYKLEFALASPCWRVTCKSCTHDYEGMQKKSLWLLQTYGSEFIRNGWFDEHAIASRKKPGLPCKDAHSGKQGSGPGR